MDQEQVDQLVATGVTRLDEHFEGRHWVDRVDWDVFDIDCHRLCVLGQLFGTYGAGIVALGLDTFDSRAAHGFLVAYGDDSQQAERLNRSWMRFAF